MSFCEKVLGNVGKVIDKGVKAGQDVKVVKKARDLTGGLLKTIGKIIATKDEPKEPKKGKSGKGMKLYIPPKAMEKMLDDLPTETKTLVESILANNKQ